MINGLVFYANIVWTYQSVFFPHTLKFDATLMFLKIFIAWINLDFGIETCFVNGLTSFWKAWLQYVFPLYIWVIAGLIIVAARQSTRLTNLIGERAVPVLNTLFLLSYMKLLRNVSAALEFSTITTYPRGSESVVWSLDGNQEYLKFPHLLLFLASLVALTLWLSYTLILFTMQWLQRFSHFWLLKWVTKFHPVYDAYFAALKPKHRYWFGVLLLARGSLLLAFVSTFATPETINLLLLFVLGVVLLYYMMLVHPYKSRGILVLQSSFIINLTLLSGCILFTYGQHEEFRPTLHAVAIGLSCGVAFLQFLGIVLYPVAKSLHKRLNHTGSCNSNSLEDILSTESIDIVSHEQEHRDQVVESDEMQPLLLWT